MAKRRRMFGSSAPAHRKRGEDAAHKAAGAAEDSFRQAHEGRCAVSLDSLLKASRDLGEAGAEHRGAGGSGLQGLMHAQNAVQQADRAYRTECTTHARRR